MGRQGAIAEGRSEARHGREAETGAKRWGPVGAARQGGAE